MFNFEKLEFGRRRSISPISFTLQPARFQATDVSD